jgi:tRNA (guanine26-N2/guanine27-N2)-dimethyltransferase
MYKIITEGKAKINVPVDEKISKKLDVFYNPVMELNRTISVVLLNSVENKNMQILDMLAGSGVRSIRFLKELKKNKIKSITINDYSEKSVNLIKENLKLNAIKIDGKRIIVKNEDANLLLLKSTGFDYIDVDPFGTPNPFLDASIKRISRNGILAVTATDTSALSGTYPDACKRKYHAVPLKNELMHEIGLRILIRKVQLIGAQYEKALTPIFSYSKEHYMRVFFRCEKGKSKVDEIIKQQDFYEKAGPVWLGQLWDKRLVEKMYKTYKIYKISKSDFLKTIMEESKIETVGFYDIHEVCKRSKIKNIPKKQILMEMIRKKGCKVSNTHFSDISIRSNISLKDLVTLLKS